MRLRVEISTGAREIPWECVLKPGRAVCYDLLAKGAPELGHRLHEKGWEPYGMVPFGFSGPVFPGAPRRRGAYAAGGRGSLDLGSPLAEVVMGWSAAIAGRELLDWGGIALRVHSVALVLPSETDAARARFRAVTPVVMKGSGRDGAGTRVTRQAWVLPGEPEYAVYFENNLRRHRRRPPARDVAGRRPRSLVHRWRRFWSRTGWVSPGARPPGPRCAGPAPPRGAVKDLDPERLPRAVTATPAGSSAAAGRIPGLAGGHA